MSVGDHRPERYEHREDRLAARPAKVGTLARVDPLIVAALVIVILVIICAIIVVGIVVLREPYQAPPPLPEVADPYEALYSETRGRVQTRPSEREGSSANETERLAP